MCTVQKDWRQSNFWCSSFLFLYFILIYRNNELTELWIKVNLILFNEHFRETLWYGMKDFSYFTTTIKMSYSSYSTTKLAYASTYSVYSKKIYAEQARQSFYVFFWGWGRCVGGLEYTCFLLVPSVTTF